MHGNHMLYVKQQILYSLSMSEYKLWITTLGHIWSVFVFSWLLLNIKYGPMLS